MENNVITLKQIEIPLPESAEPELVIKTQGVTYADSQFPVGDDIINVDLFPYAAASIQVTLEGTIVYVCKGACVSIILNDKITTFTYLFLKNYVEQFRKIDLTEDAIYFNLRSEMKDINDNKCTSKIYFIRLDPNKPNNWHTLPIDKIYSPETDSYTPFIIMFSNLLPSLQDYLGADSTKDKIVDELNNWMLLNIAQSGYTIQELEEWYANQQ